LPTLLQAVALVRQQWPEFRLQLVGDGHERALLERLTDELGLRACVAFLGERHDVPALLAQADFFVSSSRTEGISLTLLEAAAVGLPIVATRVGGNPEIVAEGRSGILAPAEESRALAAAIVAMCEARERWGEMGAAGREHVERHFEVRRMVDEYESLYESLLEGR
jgi:glycosyltransferase involved in cell wall biosynthesis